MRRGKNTLPKAVLSHGTTFTLYTFKQYILTFEINTSEAKSIPLFKSRSAKWHRSITEAVQQKEIKNDRRTQKPLDEPIKKLINTYWKAANIKENVKQEYKLENNKIPIFRCRILVYQCKRCTNYGDRTSNEKLMASNWFWGIHKWRHKSRPAVTIYDWIQGGQNRNRRLINIKQMEIEEHLSNNYTK